MLIIYATKDELCTQVPGSLETFAGATRSPLVSPER